MFILSPPLALFIVMSPKAHLTSHYRMSGSRWVTTPLWLSGSLRSFLYNSVYSCHLSLISLLLRSLLFLSFIVPILAWNVLLISSVFLTNTSTIEWCFCFGPAASFFLEVLIIPLCFSPVAYWTPSDLGAESHLQCHIFFPFHWVLMARILEWIAISFCSGPRFVRTLHYDPLVLGGPAQHGS